MKNTRKIISIQELHALTLLWVLGISLHSKHSKTVSNTQGIVMSDT